MAGGSSAEKTEKATPKRREEARKEGQVAKSMEVNSAIAIGAAFMCISIWGPHIIGELAGQMQTSLGGVATDRITPANSADFFFRTLKVLAYTCLPFFGVMSLAAIIANVAQVQLKITPEVLKPRFSKLNPINGFKQKFSLSSLFELGKNVFKMLVVGLPAGIVLWKHKAEILSLGGADPITAGKITAELITRIGFLVAGIYIAVGAADYAFQKHRYEKNIKMTKQEIREESRQQDIAPELKAAQRRRQREAARRRMMAEVPTADVVITNPTHYAVALRYDPEVGAPQVVAKGVDLLAMRIKAVARENGVARVENRPLARALYAQVEVGHIIPPDLFGAVAEILAYVYQTQSRHHEHMGAAS